MKLVYAHNQIEVKFGDRLVLRNGDQVTVQNILEPHRLYPSGKVFITCPIYTQGIAPSVIGAEWIEREDHQ